MTWGRGCNKYLCCGDRIYVGRGDLGKHKRICVGGRICARGQFGGGWSGFVLEEGYGGEFVLGGRIGEEDFSVSIIFY